MFPWLECIRGALCINKAVSSGLASAAMFSVKIYSFIQAAFHLMMDLAAKFMKFWLAFQRQKHVPLGRGFAIIGVVDQTSAANTIEEDIRRYEIQVFGRGES